MEVSAQLTGQVENALASALTKAFERPMAEFSNLVAVQLQGLGRNVHALSTQLDNIDRRFGYMDRRTGRIADHLPAPSVLRQFGNWGVVPSSIPMYVNKGP